MIAELLLAAVFSTGAVQETDGLKRNMVALEIYLKDQEEHKALCPHLAWVQPDIEVYKQQLVSQLPKECKK